MAALPSLKKPLSRLAQREILKELLTREEALANRKVASKPSEADLEKINQLLRKEMFAQNRDFFFDSRTEGRFRVARCTRRAAKTTGAALKLQITLLADPRSVSLYVAKSTTLVRDQIWPELKRFVAEYDLPFEFNETQLRMQHKRSTGRVIFRGASDTAQIDKLRGLKLAVAILDESGHFGAEMEQLVMSVISPGLRDQGGELLLIGTPGYFPEGLFYEASEGLKKTWVRRRWTLQDNVFLTDEAKDLKLIREQDGLTEDDPIYIREWLGEYCLNARTQMFHFDPAKNTFQGPPPDGLIYSLGVDFGFTDETAIVALGWSPTSRKMYAVESWAAPGQLADDVAAQLGRFRDKYRPRRIVGDTGGYGKGVAMQLFRDYGLWVEQAIKLEKLNHVEFMNSAFRRGDLMVQYKDGLVSELPKVLWNEAKTDSHNKAKDNRSHALLYVWRMANDLAGKTAPMSKLSVTEETAGWPEDILMDKLGSELDPNSNLAWFLRD